MSALHGLRVTTLESKRLDHHWKLAHVSLVNDRLVDRILCVRAKPLPYRFNLQHRNKELRKNSIGVHLHSHHSCSVATSSACVCSHRVVVPVLRFISEWVN